MEVAVRYCRSNPKGGDRNQQFAPNLRWHLAGRYVVEVIDLHKNPQLAQGDQVLAVPTLVRRLPPPLKRIIGDLSNAERVLVGLDLKPGELE